MKKDQIYNCAIVTGGAKGIGQAVVKTLASYSIHIVFGDINPDEGKRLEMEINNCLGYKAAIFVYCDVRNMDHLSTLYKAATDAFGGAQIVINGAGFYPEETVENMLDIAGPVIDTNLKSMVINASLAIRHFKKQNQTSYCLINVVRAIPDSPVYSATKDAVIQFGLSLAHLKQQNIRINTTVMNYIGDTEHAVDAILTMVYDRTAVGETIMVKQESYPLPRL